MASEAGLKKSDLVVKINGDITDKLSNDELRKIMRQRIKCNSIDLVTLSREFDEQSNFILLIRRCQRAFRESRFMHSYLGTSMTVWF